MSDSTTSPDAATMQRTADGGVIRFERLLAYPVREVWDAITDPARLADWWLPFAADISVDLREGGQMVFAVTGDQPMTLTSTILCVEPPMLLEHTHVNPGSSLRWELEAVDAGCVLRLSLFVTDTAPRSTAAMSLDCTPRWRGSHHASPVTRPRGIGLRSRSPRRATPASVSHPR